MEKEYKLGGNAGERVPQTVEEFDAFLEGYAKQNPAKYALKMASGEFERFKSKLAGYKPVKVKEEKVKEEPKKKV